MKVGKKKWIRFRIYLIAIFFLCGLGVIAARAYQLQVLEKERLSTIARVGLKRIIKLPPKRGTIYDRDRHELAVSIEVGSIYAHPRQVKSKRSTARQLSKALGIKQGKIQELLGRDRPFVWISRKVSPGEFKKVRKLGLRGIGFTTESKRFYPMREAAAHLIGFSGSENQGLEGLEKKYDGLLKGPERKLTQMKDAFGRPFYVSTKPSDEEKAVNLTLTIDKDIQYKAQQVLKKVVQKTNAKSGQSIVVNPETGEILAMAVVPLYNPNVFWKYRPSQWRNRAVTDVFEPGSAIKAFLLAAAFDRNVVTPQTRFFCEEGEYQVGNHIIHDTKKYGTLSVSDIIARSSNIGAVKIGQRLGYVHFHEYLRRFGFGERTEIDLLGERRGFVRRVEKAKEIEKATIFFGQGMSASSIQLAMAMAAIANGGKLMRPFVVKKVTDHHGKILRETGPRVVRRVVSQKTAHRVARVLERVVGANGTGPAAAIAGYGVAGKTGTSQKVDPKTKKYSNKDYVALFVGFAPLTKPRIVILIVVDEPKGSPYGGIVAAPVFQELGAWTLNHLRVNPKSRTVAIEEPAGLSDIRRQIFSPKPVRVGSSPGRLPDFRGRNMRDVLKTGRSLGLNVVLEGTGLAVKQTPRHGSSLNKIHSVKVTFMPPS